jgi:YVTN family beta-propeller protein
VLACPSAATHSFAVTPDGRYGIVATIVGKTLVAIDTATRTVASAVPSGPYPNDVLVEP